MHVIMPHLRTWLAADNNKDLLLQDLVSSHITLLVAITLVITITASLLMEQYVVRHGVQHLCGVNPYIQQALAPCLFQTALHR
jgi:hypothetical protein